VVLELRDDDLVSRADEGAAVRVGDQVDRLSVVPRTKMTSRFSRALMNWRMRARLRS